MQTLWLDTKQVYDGSQLSPLSNYLKHGVLGDSVISWCGPCRVSLEHMMDGEDLRVQSKIEGDRMLHFIFELFHFPLSSAVALQRLLGEVLILKIQQMSSSKPQLKRFGDDIYWDKKKLNISIATASVQSSLIHYGINVTNGGTPVETCALQDFGIDDEVAFARTFMDACKDEVLSLKRAIVKVRTF
jgi:uncharacterized protein